MARNTKLTPELINEVCLQIMSGAYDYVACEAVGVSQSTFYSWLQQAEQPGADPLLLEFLESVRQSRAQARSIAERAVFFDKPEVWLLKGPGREKADRPGWSNENTITVTTPIPIAFTADELTTARDKAIESERLLLGDGNDA